MLIKQGMLRKEMEKKVEKSYGFLNNSEKKGKPISLHGCCPVKGWGFGREG